MFSPSTNVVTFLARKSGPKSSSMRTASRPVIPSLAGKGYSYEDVTKSRPRSSKARFIGLAMSGSQATSWIANPGGRWNFLICSDGGSGSSFTTRSWGAAGSALSVTRSRAKRVRSM